ncbi:MAG: hypothetical protein RL562_3084, partial [Planctomycetota bacterium]
EQGCQLFICSRIPSRVPVADDEHAAGAEGIEASRKCSEHTGTDVGFLEIGGRGGAGMG